MTTTSALAAKFLATFVLTLSISSFSVPMASSGGPIPMDMILATSTTLVAANTVLVPTRNDYYSKAQPGDCAKYASLIDSYNWPVGTAMQICRDESHGDPTAINWKDKHYDAHGRLICISSQGLFQVACFWPASLGYTEDDLINATSNIAMAYDIWKELGFGQWTTYTPTSTLDK